MSELSSSADMTSYGITKGMKLLDDRFEILDIVRSGAFGAVYKAMDRGLDEARVVALKLIHPQVVQDIRAFKNIQREVGIARELGHPNLVKIWALEQWRDFTFITMQFIEGTDLGNVAAGYEGCRLPLEKAIKYIREIAAGLDYLHQHEPQIIHRDLKPSNIMIDSRADTAVITDFGLAREIKDSLTRRTGDIAPGTAPYIAPEIWDNEPPSPASDIYALGITVYEILAGDLPFKGPDFRYQHQTINPKPIPSLNEHQNQCIMKAMAKKPGDRFGSAGEFTTELEEYKSEKINLNEKTDTQEPTAETEEQAPVKISEATDNIIPKKTEKKYVTPTKKRKKIIFIGWLISSFLVIIFIILVIIMINQHNYMNDSQLHEIVPESTLPLEASTEEIISAELVDVIRVQILNGCYVSGLAARTADYLRTKGFDVRDCGNAPELHPNTMIYVRYTDKRMGEKLAETIDLPLEMVKIQPDSSFTDIDVTLFLGKDYKKYILPR